MILVGVLFLLIVLFIYGGFIFYFYFLVRDSAVPLKKDIIPEGCPKRALLVFPHPDDELSCARTVLAMKEDGLKFQILDQR